MIKIEKDYLYLTLGEGCYIMRVADGMLYSLCFGRRVEPEDDLTALGIDGTKEFEVNSGICGKRPTETDFTPDVVIDAGSGERLKVDLRFETAETTEKPNIAPYPSLRGDKTLCVRLCDKSLGLYAELYYTTYARGGISRTVKLINTGARTLKFRAPSFSCAVGRNAVMRDSSTERHLNFAAAEGKSGAYGLCTIYGGAVLTTLFDGTFDAELDEDILLAPDTKMWLPETLAVYSPDGFDALTRALYDILRESLLPERFFSLRRPIAFFGGRTAVDSVVRLGADAFVTDARLGDDVAEFAEDCKAAGLMSGVRIAATVGKKSLDLAEADERDAFIADVERLIAVGVEYLDLSEVAEKQNTHSRVLGFYDVLSRLIAAHGDIVLAVAADYGALRFAPIAVCKNETAALPPCAVKRTVLNKGAVPLKSEFDCASVGCLCYEFDIAAASEELCRAVRAQVFCYQDDAAVIVTGDIYQSKDGATVTAISKDKSKAYAVCAPSRDIDRAYVSGVDVHALYDVRELDKVFSGAAIVGFGLPLPKLKKGETVSFHLRQVTDYE